MKVHTPDEIREYYMDRLGDGLGLDSREQVSVRCPFHEDGSPSFSVNLESGLWTCHAGCGSGNLEQFERRYVEAGLGLPAVEEDEALDSHVSRSTIEYSYEDEQGAEVYQVVRHDHQDGGKHFHCRYRGADGVWINKIPEKRVPYHLPDVTNADLVIVCEGEKCVEAVRGLSLSGVMGKAVAATCNPFGAGKWQQEYNRYFSGKRVVILPDNDDNGRKHAQDVAASLAGVAAEIKVVELPGLDEKGDIADFVELRLQDAGTALAALIAAAQPRTAVKAAGAADKPFINMAEFRQYAQREVVWTVEGLMPEGGTSVFAAKPKVGKSTLSRQLVVAVAQGRPFLGRNVMQGGVIYVGLEDSPSRSYQHFVSLGMKEHDPILVYNAWQMPGLTLVRSQLQSRPDIKLVVLDTLFKVCPVGSADDYAQVTKVFNGIHELCRQFNIHISVIHHMAKVQKDDPFDGILGSTAILAAVDTAIVLQRDRQNERTICTRQRDGRDLEQTKLAFDLNTGSSDLALPVQPDFLQESAVETPYDRICHEIRMFLTKNPGATEDLIMVGIQGKNSVKTSALRQMIGTSVQRDGAGRKGDPYHYRVAEIPVETAPTTLPGPSGNDSLLVQ